MSAIGMGARPCVRDLNLHVEHTPQGVDKAADAFRSLIDLGPRTAAPPI